MMNICAYLSPKQKKVATVLAVTFLAYLLFGFLGAPPIVRHILEKRVSAAINREISVDTVRINPLTLSATLRKLDIRERTGEPFAKGYLQTLRP